MNTHRSRAWAALAALVAAGALCITPAEAGSGPQAKSHLAAKAGDMITLIAFVESGQTRPFVRILADGSVPKLPDLSDEPFVPPAGTALVLTDFQALGFGAGRQEFSICIGSGSSCDTIFLILDTEAFPRTSSLSLTSGLAITKGPLALMHDVDGEFAQGRITAYGYLVKAP